MTAIARELRVLLVEDSIDDTLLLQRELRRGGYDPVVRRVEDRAALAAALADGCWDAVICDYILPRITPLEALQTVRESGQDLPFIVVSGRIGEEEAVDILKAGAHDFVTKERLSRLVPAIERERREAASRAEGRRAAQALRESEERYRTLVESLRDYAICLLDARGQIASWNGGAARIFGYTAAEVVGTPFSRLLESPETSRGRSRWRPERLLDAAARAGTADAEGWTRRKDGTGVLIDLQLTGLRDADGALRGYTLVCRDITEQVRIAEERLQSQKMEVIGRLVGGVAHDFNNLLSIIHGFAELVLETSAPDEPRRPHLEEILNAAEQAASLTNQLLAFGRRQVFQPRVVELNDVIAGMQKMLRRVIGEDVELIVQLRAVQSRVYADPVQLQQVLLNLVINARDAMPNGGTVTIATANDRPTPSWEAATAGAPHVTLSVADTGHGMDAATMARIFEPFFTTKAVGKGTGLGLSTVERIVAQSEGQIAVASEPGRGATFTIILPLTEDAAQDGADGEAAAARAGSETILLVEDEAPLRRLIRRALDQRGYTVIEAPDGEEALRAAEAYRGRIHLVLTDVVMPRLSGRDLARRVVKSHPEARILYMSGYTEDDVVQHGVMTEGVALLQKPFTPSVLAARIREVLDSAPGR